MPIVASEIKLYKSSTAPGIGGAIDTGSLVTSGVMNNLFPNITAAEATTTVSEYRCIYVKNTNSSIDLLNTKVFISTNTPSDNTTITIGLAAAAIDSPETATANSNTAPAGVSFSNVSTYNTGLSIGTLPHGSYKGIWVKRYLTAGAAAAATDGCTITIQGDTEV